MGFHVSLGQCKSLSSTGSALNLRVFMMHVPVGTASEPPRGFADFGSSLRILKTGSLSPKVIVDPNLRPIFLKPWASVIPKHVASKDLMPEECTD